jgi:hypothetical protein
MNDLNVTGGSGVALTAFPTCSLAYGGLTAAISLEVTQRSFPDLAPLRSAQFAFIGPASGELHLLPHILRPGKSTVFAGGQFPLSGHTPPEMLVWVRHTDQSAPEDVVRLIAAADAQP